MTWLAIWLWAWGAIAVGGLILDRPSPSLAINILGMVFWPIAIPLAVLIGILGEIFNP